MYTGKVVKTFRDKHTSKIHRKGSEYSHEDEKRLKELSKLGFVKYGDSKTQKEKKQGARQAKSKEKD